MINSIKGTSNVQMIDKNVKMKENKSGYKILWSVWSQFYLKDAHGYFCIYVYACVFIDIYT